MRTNWKHLDKYRQQGHPAYKSPQGATYGAFNIPHEGMELRVIASDGFELVAWEHVSVHAYDAHFEKARTPTWSEMCFIKELFFNDDEVVLQYHPANEDYVNVHPHVLHLWRPTKESIPLPPKVCV